MTTRYNDQNGDAQMTALRGIWGLETFRELLRDLVEADPALRSRLFAYAEGGMDEETLVESPFDKHTSRLLTVIGTLTQIKENEGGRALAADLRRLEEATGLSIVEPLGDFLAESPEERSAVVVRDAQRSVLPAVIRLELTLDFRVSRPESEEPEVLVPVALARIGLDEEVAGMSAFVLQIPDALLDELEVEIAEYKARRKRMLNKLPDAALPYALSRDSDAANAGEEL